MKENPAFQVMQKQSTPPPVAIANGEEGWEDCGTPSGSNFFIKFHTPEKTLDRPPEALLDLMGMKRAQAVDKAVDLEKKYPFTVRAFTSWGYRGAITPALAHLLKANLEVVGREAAEEMEAKWEKFHLEEIQLLMKRYSLQAEHTRRVLAALNK